MFILCTVKKVKHQQEERWEKPSVEKGVSTEEIKTSSKQIKKVEKQAWKQCKQWVTRQSTILLGTHGVLSAIERIWVD